MARANSPKIVSFRWAYVALPLLLLAISLAMLAFFYGRLSPEAAYRFSGGQPSGFISRGGLMGWGLGLQLVFTLLALSLTFMVTFAARRMQLNETPLNRMLFAIIGNVVALPQIIVAYALTGIFIYDVYARSLPPVWIVAVGVMLAGALVLAALFARAMVLARRLKTQNITGSGSDAK